LEEVGISCNKNMIPFDTRSPMNPSGIRLGTPAITTRGLGVEEIKIIASVIDQAIVHHDNADKVIELKKIIHSLCEKFPLWYD
jgi:glycine hydroxymethyltransferase